MVAAGLMEWDEAVGAMWQAADKLAAPDIDRSGLRARIAWALTDATLWAERMRGKVAHDIARHLASMLARRAPWDALIAAAQDMNNAGARAGDQPMLRPHELNKLVAAEAAWWMRRRARNVG